MYKDSTIVRELARHRCGLGSIFRPTQCKRNFEDCVKLCYQFTSLLQVSFFSPQFFGFVHWLFKQTLQLQI